MKHIISLTLVDSVGKPYGSIRSTRGLEYTDDEISHDDAYKRVEDSVYHHHMQALKRAMLDVREVNAKFKPITGTAAKPNIDQVMTPSQEGEDRAAQKASKQPNPQIDELLWKDGKGRRGPYEWLDRGDAPDLYKRISLKTSNLKLNGYDYWLGTQGDRIFRRPVNGG